MYNKVVFITWKRRTLVLERLVRIIEYLGRSLKIARKSIFFNFKQYIYFFVALLIVQMFYGIMTISSYNNEVVERESATEVYDYDVMLTHLNRDQYEKGDLTSPKSADALILDSQLPGM